MVSKVEIEEAMDAALRAAVRCQTPGGQYEEQHEVKCGGPFCLFGAKSDKEVTFVIPDGHVRTTFSHAITPEGINAGGGAAWVSNNPRDGRIRIHLWCDGKSKCTGRVWDVMAMPA